MKRTGGCLVTGCPISVITSIAPAHHKVILSVERQIGNRPPRHQNLLWHGDEDSAVKERCLGYDLHVLIPAFGRPDVNCSVLWTCEKNLAPVCKTPVCC